MKISKKLSKLTAVLSAVVFAASADLSVYADTLGPDSVMMSGDPDIFDLDNAEYRSNGELPARFDLRDVDGKNYVTPVRDQGLLNTCWAFACCAASETSILYELAHEHNMEMDPSQLVLSPKHLAWFTYDPLPADNEYYPAQAGEGGSYLNMDGSDAPNALDIGGTSYRAISTLSMGMGPSYEYLDPYKNKSGDLISKEGEEYYAVENEEWSCDEDHRFFSAFELEDANVLPAPVVTGHEGQMAVHNIDMTANNVIKSELLKGRGVVIGHHFDLPTTDPEENDHGRGVYISSEYAQYTYYCEQDDHEVCIVGWDDNYSRDHFLQGNDPDGGVSMTPPADGAWIVKNSYGALDNSFPDHGSFGVDGSGYFYLSYYDKSIVDPVSFNYYTDDIYKENRDHLIDQHDLMMISKSKGIKTSAPQLMSNVFEVRQNEDLKAVSVRTVYPDTQVTYRVYKLYEDTTDPTNGQLMKEISTIYPYAGFHRTNFDQSVRLSEGDHYSIVVSQKVGDDYILPLNYAQNRTYALALRDQFASYGQGGKPLGYSIGVINRGESYYTVKNNEGVYEWRDLIDMIPELRGTITDPQLGPNDVDFDNFPIKGYADPIEELRDDRITLQFDTDGGTEVAPIIQHPGTVITRPADPTKIGYTFVGWDKEIPAAMPRENMTFKAIWTIDQYTITFDTAGGTEIAPITQAYGTAVTAPAAPAREGYTFVGWDKVIPETMPAENIMITAIWTSIGSGPFIPSYVPPSTAMAITTPIITATTDMIPNITDHTITGRQNEINESELKWDAIPDASAYSLYIKVDDEYVFVQDLGNVTGANIALGSNGKYYVSAGGDYTVYEYDKTAKFYKTGTLKANKIENIVKANDVTMDFMVKYTRNGRGSDEKDPYKVSVRIYYKPAPELATGKDPITGKSFIRLRWAKVNGATAYRVCSYDNGKLRTVTELDADHLALKISGTRSGKTYTYAVKAYVDGKWTKVYTSDLASIKSE